MARSRHDFSTGTKRALAARVNLRCSNPECRAPTGGPQADIDKALNVGVAAHISAAAPGGPRYDARLEAAARGGAENGVWLCQNCAKLVDNDPVHFDARLIRAWKESAEREALNGIGKPHPQSIPHEAPTDKFVSVEYVEEAKICERLTREGYRPYWAAANDEHQRVDLLGWERVVIDNADGSRSYLKIHDHPVIGGYLILLKKRT